MTPTPALSPARRQSSPAKKDLRGRRDRQPLGRPLEIACESDVLAPLANSLHSRVVGQDPALETLLCSFSRLLSGLCDPSRPLLTALLLGPTGVGKTETVRALAQALFGHDRAMTRINCEELSHSHEVAKLLGSPPGYVGHNIEPLLSQARIDGPHEELRKESESPEGSSLVEEIAERNGGGPIAVVLFDEIEKAHPVVWNSLLGILEDGLLTLGNNATTDFSHAILIMTSNVGGREMGSLLDPNPLGFSSGSRGGGDLPIEDVALDAARRHFPLEFLNRFDETLVYTALEREDLEEIFGKFLAEIHERTVHQAKTPLLLKISPQAADWIIERGTDPMLGARPLRRAMEREIVGPLSRLIASRQLEAGDVVKIEREGDRLAFYRRGRQSQKIVA